MRSTTDGPISEDKDLVGLAAHLVESLHGLESLERGRGLESQDVEEREQRVLPILVLQMAVAGWATAWLYQTVNNACANEQGMRIVFEKIVRLRNTSFV